MNDFLVAPKRINIDFDKAEMSVEGPEGKRILSISSPEGFHVLSQLWLRSGFDNKYAYGFSWMGRPVIQLPEDLVRIQEVIYSVKPDWIIETGVAHGGGLVFYASLCKAMGKGKAIGIDVEIRAHNRAALEAHPLREHFRLIEGDSVSDAVLTEVRGLVREGSKVMVVLDSKHGKEHVLKELRAYAPFVSPNSYMVVADGIMAQMASSPLAGADWAINNPLSAIREFLETNPEFRQEEQVFPFNEGQITQRVTYWPGGFLRKISMGTA